MNREKSLKNEKLFLYGERILFIGFFLVAYVLCGFISYTDGDDAYFSGMAHSMSFFEYLKMRYVGWEGRMTSEAMTYIAFYFGKGFWEVVNAWVLTLLPGGLIHILKKMAGNLSAKKSFFLALTGYVLILSVGTGVIGYGAFWITGSTFYLWSIVAGVWAVMPFVDLVYRKEKLDKRSFIYAIPCGFIAAMGQEQIAAVVIAFGGLAIGYDLWRQHYEKKALSSVREQPGVKTEICWWHILEEVLMIVALIVLFISPGTGARTQSEIATWMPQYNTMSVGNHIFITVQWMLSSFANEGKMLFVVIWLGIMLFWLKKRKVLAVIAAVEAIVALLPVVGITLFSEMGMGDVGMTQCVEQVATPASVSGQNWLAMLWWLVAIILMIAMLWQIEERIRDKVVMSLILLAACASEAIMFFSPTMYASGPRVYFMAQILLWLLAGRLCERLLENGVQYGECATQQVSCMKMESKEVYGYVAVAVVIVAAIVNVLNGLPMVLTYL